MELVKDLEKEEKQGDYPKDWDKIQLGDIANVQRGASPRPISSPRWFSLEKEVGWVRISDISDSDGKNLYKTKDYLSQDGIDRSRFLPAGSLIMSIAATVGVPVITQFDTCIHDGFVGLTNLKVDQEFLYYKLKEIESELIKEGQTGSQTNINSEIVRNYEICIPSTLEEQQAIAEALSDVDALISELNTLIEKKQQVKKAAMQQLLVGKKRLPGFDGEWEEKTLEEIGNTYNGLSGKSGADFGDGNRPYIPFLNVMNNAVIDTSHFDTVKIKPGESQSTAEKGDLFFNTSSETPEEVGMCSVLLEDVEDLHLNSFCFGFRLFDQNDVVPLFLAYYFRSQYGREHMSSLAQGSTRYNLSKSKFIKIKVYLPSFEEQKAIAGILSDMDTEIQALQSKRDKYEKIKQGMMQELLTGKTRLV